MKGILYGVGVGPGDPELMTVKAVRLIREAEVIALPGPVPEETRAYQTAAGAVPEIQNKDLLPIQLSMIRDPAKRKAEQRHGAVQIEEVLQTGRNVVFLTLGDVTVYSTFSYLQELVEADGYPCELVNGVPSFCAAAAVLGTSLCQWDEPVHIYPAIHHGMNELPGDGTIILMKVGSRTRSIKDRLKQCGRGAMMAENCGCADERLFHHIDEIPDTAAYNSLIISKN